MVDTMEDDSIDYSALLMDHCVTETHIDNWVEDGTVVVTVEHEADWHENLASTVRMVSVEDSTADSTAMAADFSVLDFVSHLLIDIWTDAKYVYEYYNDFAAVFLVLLLLLWIHNCILQDPLADIIERMKQLQHKLLKLQQQWDEFTGDDSGGSVATSIDEATLRYFHTCTVEVSEEHVQMARWVSSQGLACIARGSSLASCRRLLSLHGRDCVSAEEGGGAGGVRSVHNEDDVDDDEEDDEEELSDGSGAMASSGLLHHLEVQMNTVLALREAAMVQLLDAEKARCRRLARYSATLNKALSSGERTLALARMGPEAAAAQRDSRGSTPAALYSMTTSSAVALSVPASIREVRSDMVSLQFLMEHGQQEHSRYSGGSSSSDESVMRSQLESAGKLIKKLEVASRAQSAREAAEPAVGALNGRYSDAIPEGFVSTATAESKESYFDAPLPPPHQQEVQQRHSTDQLLSHNRGHSDEMLEHLHRQLLSQDDFLVQQQLRDAFMQDSMELCSGHARMVALRSDFYHVHSHTNQKVSQLYRRWAKLKVAQNRSIPASILFTMGLCVVGAFLVHVYNLKQQEVSSTALQVQSVLDSICRQAQAQSTSPPSGSQGIDQSGCNVADEYSHLGLGNESCAGTFAGSTTALLNASVAVPLGWIKSMFSSAQSVRSAANSTWVGGRTAMYSSLFGGTFASLYDSALAAVVDAIAPIRDMLPKELFLPPSLKVSPAMALVLNGEARLLRAVGCVASMAVIPLLTIWFLNYLGWYSWTWTVTSLFLAKFLLSNPQLIKLLLRNYDGLLVVLVVLLASHGYLYLWDPWVKWTVCLGGDGKPKKDLRGKAREKTGLGGVRDIKPNVRLLRNGAWDKEDQIRPWRCVPLATMRRYVLRSDVRLNIRPLVVYGVIPALCLLTACWCACKPTNVSRGIGFASAPDDCRNRLHCLVRVVKLFVSDVVDVVRVMCQLVTHLR